jgi:O-antigen ligase
LAGSAFTKDKCKTAIIVFTAGCASACFVLLGWATYDFIKTGDQTVFVYTTFSRFMHVSYFSMYLLVCFGWFFMVAMEDKLLFPKTHYFLMALYAVCLVLISAKITLIAFIISSFLFAGYYAQRKKKMAVGIAIISFFMLMPILLYFISPNMKVRTDFFVSEIKNINHETAPESLGSASLRMVIWRDSWPHIKQNLPLGVSSGDVQQLLQENYQRRHMQTAIERKFNMHNEYLQQLAGLGLFGFFAFITIILLPAFVCSPPYRFVGILFSFTVATVSLTESILERQAGTIFICLVGMLLMITYGKERKSFTNS